MSQLLGRPADRSAAGYLIRWRTVTEVPEGVDPGRVGGANTKTAIDSLPAVNHQPEFTAAAITEAAVRAILDGGLALAWTAIDAEYRGVGNRE